MSIVPSKVASAGDVELLAFTVAVLEDSSTVIDTLAAAAANRPPDLAGVAGLIGQIHLATWCMRQFVPAEQIDAAKSKREQERTAVGALLIEHNSRSGRAA